MRLQSVDLAIKKIKELNIDCLNIEAIDIGGTREVYLEESEPSKNFRWLISSMYKIFFSKNNFIVTPFFNIKVRSNPLLEYFPNLIFFDKGFNSDCFDTTSDYEADFLSEAAVCNLNNKYHLTFSFDTLEHIPNPVLFCKNLCSITKPGGYIYLSTVFLYEYHPSPEDYFRFSPKGLIECFAGLDAEVVSCDWEIFNHSVYILLHKKVK